MSVALGVTALFALIQTSGDPDASDNMFRLLPIISAHLPVIGLLHRRLHPIQRIFHGLENLGSSLIENQKGKN